MELISNTIARAVAGDLPNLILVEMPPRHGKSETVSKWTPTWFLERFPHKRVILTSYEADFAASWGAKVRDNIIKHTDRLTVRIHPQSKSRRRWDTTEGGGMITAGAGGPITGRGAHLLIVDDPIKNAQDARSATLRESIWQWWLTTARTRLEPGGVAVVVMTRWHHDDLVGRLIRQADETGRPYVRLRLPALCENADDPLEQGIGRQVGQALWPARYNEAALDLIRRDDAITWAALYQQRPVPLEGLLFKREHFRYWEKDADTGLILLHRGDGVTDRIEPKALRKFATMDLAMTTKQKSDYTVLSTWGATPKKDLVWLDMVRTKMEGPDHLPLIKQVYAAHKHAFVGIERAQYQLSLVQQALREGIPARELKAEGDKVARALTAATRIQAHTIFFPKHAAWLAEAEEEIVNFDSWDHDDIVDALAYAAIILGEGWVGTSAPSLVGKGRASTFLNRI